MDLSRFDSKRLAEDGVKCELLDPITKAATGAALILYGADSSIHKEARRELDARNKALARELAPAEREAQVCELLARCTKGWEGLEEGGKPIPFSQKKAAELYEQYPEIADRAAAFIFSRANFFGRPSGA